MLMNKESGVQWRRLLTESGAAGHLRGGGSSRGSRGGGRRRCCGRRLAEALACTAAQRVGGFAAVDEALTALARARRAVELILPVNAQKAVPSHSHARNQTHREECTSSAAYHDSSG
jgi:hypothetical protein